MRRLLVILLVLGTACIAECQCFNTVVNRYGWKIPGLEGSKPEKPTYDYKYPGQQVSVSATEISPGNEFDSLPILRCVPAEPEKLNLWFQSVRVENLWRFEHGGKLFAYGVNGGWGGRDSNGKWTDIGEASLVLFYDDKGDGKFRVMQYTTVYPFAPVVPAWALKNDSPPAGQSTSHKN